MKKITIADIAQIAGVSTATVIRVVHNNGYVAEDKRAAVTKAIKETGYVAVNKQRQTSPARFIGVILPNEDNLYHQKLLQLLAVQIRQNGYFPTVVMLERSDAASLAQAVRDMQEGGIQGVINLTDPGKDAEAGMMNRLLDCNIPVLMLERGGGYGLDRVLVDAKEGVYIATRYLISQGHRHLAYIGRKIVDDPYSDDVDYERRAGYERAIREFQGIILESVVEQTEAFAKNLGCTAMARIRKEHPAVTGVVTAADSLAAGALDYLYENHISVPDEISLIGHDDTYARFLTPPLTTVAMPYEEMARTAVNIILQKKEDPLDRSVRTLVLSPQLILRNTVAEIKEQ